MMKTYLLATAAVVGMALAPVTTPVFAQSENAAWVDKDFGCGGFVPNPDGSPGWGLTTDESHKVVTGKGNLSFYCHFDIPEGYEPEKATHADGFLCGYTLPDGSWLSTSDTKMVATPGGRATLICKVNGSTDK